jgi:hypothetical protein
MYGMECENLKYLAKQDVSVPCGQCVFCLATKRSDWALRLMYEQKCHVGSKFVTLTYADGHLVWKNGNSQLHVPHLQEFFRNMRGRGSARKLRYFAVGEYGSRTFRPHYHVILFGDVPEDVVRKAWKYGHVHIGSVNDRSIMYSLGYVVNGSSWKMRKDRVRPFAVMSRRPGIGASYLSSAMIDWHRSERKNYAIVDGVKRHLPRYYKEKIFSKIDRVRIAVRDQKEHFKREVDWVRSPAMVKQRDPLAYRGIQRRRLAQRIRCKTKNNLTI